METPPSIHVPTSCITVVLFFLAVGSTEPTICLTVDTLDATHASCSDDYISLLQTKVRQHTRKLPHAEEIDEDSSDPFHEVSQKALRDIVRDGYDLQPVASASNATLPAIAVIESGRTAKSAHTWDVVAVRNALTSVECQGSERKRSCAFKNLYFNYDEGGFYVFSLKGTRHPDFHSVLLLHKWSRKGAIKHKIFSSLGNFRAFLDEHLPTAHQGLSLIFDSVWHQNIGHAIWDGLYPAFSALCEWGREAENFRSVVGFKESRCQQRFTDDGKCMSEGVFRSFGGDELLPYMDLKREGWQRFDDCIAGSGRKGQRSLSKDYSLPGSREKDRVRTFRDRMYSSHGLGLPRTHAVVEAASRKTPSTLHGVIIDNKRFASSEVELLQHIASNVSGSGIVDLKYIDFGAKPFRGKFRSQLELIGTLALQISGPGTAQAYTPFLPDGSVHINLGDRRKLPGDSERIGLPGGRSVSFMEEVWSEGIPYVRALYYDPYLQTPVALDKAQLMSLITQGVGLIQEKFPIPVLAGENLSPIAKVFTEYCKAIGPDCDDLIGLLNGDKRAGFATAALDVSWCVENAWAESIVFEIGGWSERGQQDDDDIVHCRIDHQVLRQIRTRRLGW